MYAHTTVSLWITNFDHVVTSLLMGLRVTITFNDCIVQLLTKMLEFLSSSLPQNSETLGGPDF